MYMCMSFLNDYVCFWFDSITYWIRFIQKVFYTIDLIMKDYMYMVIFKIWVWICKGFFNGYDKDDFHEIRSKIHQFMLRTICELNIHISTSCLFTSSYFDYDLVFGLRPRIHERPRIQYDFVLSATSYSIMNS